MNKKTAKIIYGVLIFLLAAVFFYCGFSLVKYYSESNSTKKEYDELSQMINEVRPTIAFPFAGDSTVPPAEATEPSGEAPTEATEPTEPPIEYVTVKHPKTGKEVQMLPEFASLFEINPNIVGWISIDDTRVDYPVVKSPSGKKDYYLRRNFYGKYATAGTIYAREECDVFGPSDNITIYGHRMQDGSMFMALLDYKDPDFYPEHRYIRFDTLTQRGLYEIIAVFKTDATIGKGFSYHLFVDAANEKEFDEFVSTCKELALYDTGVDAEYGDKLITLSTCDYYTKNGRLVVVAKKVA